MMSTEMSRAITAVAEDFVETMKDSGFETFAEMKRCYMMDSEDIRAEVDSILRDRVPEVCVDEDDGTMVIADDGDEMTYRKFMSCVYSEIKTMMAEEA